MDSLLPALLGGLGSGLVVAIANYWFTCRLMDTRNSKEFKSYRCQRIVDLVDRFEDVRVNYERMHHKSAPDPEFQIRGHETIALTLILKDLRVYRPLLSNYFYQLMERKFAAAGRLAVAIGKDEAAWTAAIAEWEEIGTELSTAIDAEFYSQGITSPSSRHS